MSARTPIVLDVDTGVDDACALLLAALHPDLDLRAVTCAAGNAPLPQVVRNTLTVLDACGRGDVPVAAAKPPLEGTGGERRAHGEDGMGDLDWPRSERAPDPRHAAELLRDVLLDAAADDDPVALVSLAPMTNIARLLRTYPAVAPGIGRIVFIGGADRIGNATTSADFNVVHDPEAAATTLDACADLGIEVVMYGLDVFYGPHVSLEQAQALARRDEAPAALAGRLMIFQCGRFGEASATIGDAGAVCAVLDPGGLSTRRLPVRIEPAGTRSAGRTIVDRGDLAPDPHGERSANVHVALEVDGERYAKLWLDTVTGAS